MEELIYKFLDEYVGDGAICKNRPGLICHVIDGVIYRIYGIHSNNGTLIFEVIVSENKDRYKFIRSNDLSKTVSRFFGVDEPFNYVRDWFRQKYDLEKVSDISKFIDE